MKEKKNIYQTLFKFSSAILIIFFIYILILTSSNKSLKNEIKFLRENTEAKCYDGAKQECVPIGMVVSWCEKGESSVCVGEDETYTICDTDRKERAICVSEDNNWIECDVGQYATCIDKDKDTAVCKEGYNPICVKDGTAAYVLKSGNWYPCDSDEESTCIDWDKNSICPI